MHKFSFIFTTFHHGPINFQRTHSKTSPLAQMNTNIPLYHVSPFMAIPTTILIIIIGEDKLFDKPTSNQVT